MSLGAFTTIPKAPRGRAIAHEQSFYLNIVHVDIAFGDCVSTGGFQYSLVFVHQATHYSWVFGLKDLSSASILAAFRMFWADTGSYRSLLLLRLRHKTFWDEDSGTPY